MILHPIGPAEIETLLPLLGPYLDKMAARFPDDWPVAEIVRQAEAGTLLLWLIWDDEERKPYGLIGTEVLLKPSGRKFLTVRLAAGDDQAEWTDEAERRLLQHARENGCAVFEIVGRGGWERVLTGYRPSRWVILEKDVT